jgi:hypothetical protein
VSRYELILRQGGRDEYVILDQAEPVHEGAVLTLKGRRWIAHHDPDLESSEADVTRLLCTPADVEPHSPT